MTPFRMRLCVGVFAAVAAAISINALYLQQAPRIAGAAVQTLAPSPSPAPSETVASTGAQSATAALPKQDAIVTTETVAEKLVALVEPAARPAPARSPAKPAPARLVRAIQRELSDRGYAVGEDNGVLGLQTRAAILGYEFDAGMPLTGEPAEAVLKSLIFGRASGQGGPGPSERFERRQRLVAQVQEALAALHYRSGPADGRLDRATREAIRKFENDHRLQAAGRLTERVLLELVIATGQPLQVDG
jgi:peptidoglycan hydrolase-like protein with peptidoglycan-binding domain